MHRNGLNLDLSVLENLRRAKNCSDLGDMHTKNAILGELMELFPTEFVIDEPGNKFPGLVHTPTAFRIHVDRNAIPADVWARNGRLKASFARFVHDSPSCLKTSLR